MLARFTIAVVVLSFVSLAWAGGSGPSYMTGHAYRDFDLNVTPYDITAGPDEGMWITDAEHSAILRLGQDGEFRSYPIEFGSPHDITVGPDNNLWYVDSSSRAIGRFTLNRQNTFFPVPTGRPEQIVAGFDNNLWFTTGETLSLARGFQTTGLIGRITLSGTVSTFVTDRPSFSITSGSDGALWVTTTDRIGRVTTNGQDQYFDVDGFPAYITAGPDQALWFTNRCFRPEGPAGTLPDCFYGVGRLTTDGELTKYRQVDPDIGPANIVRGPEDNLWFSSGDGRVWRLTPAGRLDDVVTFDDEAPSDLAVGPDGGLWFVLQNSLRIGKVSSLARSFIEIANSGPLGMAPGLNGSMWFTDEIGNRVGHINGAGLVQYELGDLHSPTGIAAAPDGGAFFTNFDSGTIGRITADGEFVEYALPAPNDSPEEIVLGPDGNFWFTIDINAIGRITQNGVVTIFPLPTEDGGPQGIAVGPDGNLWFTELIANRIARMSTNGESVDFPIPTADSEPWDIIAGPDGYMYFTMSRAGRIARISQSGQVTELGEPNPAYEPRDITLGPDGAVWYTLLPVFPDTMLAAQAATPQPRGPDKPVVTPTLAPARLGRVANDGRITTFDVIPNAVGLDLPIGPAGIAGSSNGQLYLALYDAELIAVFDLVAAQPFATPTPTLGPELHTATPTEGLPGLTPTATRTRTSGSTTCAGDCDGNGSVSIAELISAVNIALGNRPLDTCDAIDIDGDGAVRINELITAVSRALQGC